MLQSYVAAECGLGDPDATCAAGNYSLANQQVAQRAFADRVTALFARETIGEESISPSQAERVERKIARKAERFAKRHKIQRRSESSGKCGFVVIGLIFSGLVSWLLGKVFDALWRWYFRSKPALRATIGGEAFRCAIAGDEEDED